MSARIVGELEFFARSFVWGIFITLVYDCLRLFRQAVHHGNVWVALEDLLYWVVYALLLFRMMYLENDGMIRGFALLAVLLGMLLYLQFRKLTNNLRKKLQNRMKSLIIKDNHQKKRK